MVTTWSIVQRIGYKPRIFLASFRHIKVSFLMPYEQITRMLTNLTECTEKQFKTFFKNHIPGITNMNMGFREHLYSLFNIHTVLCTSPCCTSPCCISPYCTSSCCTSPCWNFTCCTSPCCRHTLESWNCTRTRVFPMGYLQKTESSVLFFINEYRTMLTSVPRRLFFTALQWIAIAQGPKIQQKSGL